MIMTLSWFNMHLVARASAGRGRCWVLLPLLGLVWLLLTPATASAHANLVRAEPAVGTAVPTAPTQIKIWFSEQPEPKYSSINVYDTSRTSTIRVAPSPSPATHWN